MSACSGPDCDHSSHGGIQDQQSDKVFDQAVDKVLGEKFKKVESEGPTMAMTCDKCGTEVNVPEGSPNPIHGNCGGLLSQPDGRGSPERTIDAPDHAVFRVGEIIALKGYHFRFVGYTKGDWKVVFEARGPTAKTIKRNGRH